MKRIWLFCLLFVFGFVFVLSAAEDLGELAKKEKARREAIEKTGKKARTLTNADIPNIKSELAIQQVTPPPGEEQEAEEQPAEEAAAAESKQPSAVDRELEELKAEKEDAEIEAEEARETVGQGGLFHTRNIGSQYQTAREAEKKSKELDEKIKKKESGAKEEEQEEF